MNVFDDDFDPLAPPGYGGEEPQAELGADESDGGVSDYERVVRVWVEDGHLTKVRVSPVWFHKVKDGAGLEAKLREALMLATLREPVPVETPEEKPFPLETIQQLREVPTLSRGSLVMFDQMGREMDQRHAAAMAEAQAAPSREIVSARSKGVTVVLNKDGVAERVTFDTKWLDEAQVGSICTHIMVAAERAYTRFSALEVEPDVAAEMAEERRLYKAALLTMLQPPEARA